MTWREQTICRILLLVARLLCTDPDIDQELKHLTTHIGVRATSDDKTKAVAA